VDLDLEVSVVVGAPAVAGAHSLIVVLEIEVLRSKKMVRESIERFVRLRYESSTKMARC
jgi:hypothetical protein